MTLGEQITTLRKRKKLSQGDLGKLIKTSGDIIGRYERDEVKPSIEVASKIADALGVSIDYLVGKTSLLMDKQIIDRIEDIARLPEEKKSYLYSIIDMCLRDFKTRRTYAAQ